MADNPIDMLIRNWGVIALRGVAALLFGVLTLVNPAASLAVLILLFGAYALVAGAFTIIAAVANRRGERRWVPLLVSGMLSLAVGGGAFLLPHVTAVVLVYLIAGWAIVTGVAETVTAVRLRKVITGEWLLIVAAVLSVAFGLALIVYPGAGALAVALWIGAYATVFGILLIALALRLRRWGRAQGAVGAPRTA